MPLWHTRCMAGFFSKQTFRFVGQPCSLEATSGLEICSGEQTIAQTLYHLYNTVVGQRKYSAAGH